MELYEDDLYICEVPDKANLSLSDLFVLYQPLVGAKAISLFGTLWSEGLAFDQPNNHERLCKLTQMDIDEIHAARMQLERYGLVKTYFHSSAQQYLYRLVTPLTGSKFFEHYIYGLQYKNNLGLMNFEKSRMAYMNQKYSTSGYKDISEKLDKDALLKISAQDMNEFIGMKSNTPVEDGSFGFSSLFEYQKFTQGLTKLTFPNELRTNENMRFIGKLSTITGINVNRLRELACQSIDYKAMVLQKEKLLKKVMSDKDIVIDESKGYDLAPYQFLQAKQNGVPVSSASVKTLEYLVNDTNFTTDVINVLVEFVLLQSDNKLPKAYVEQVAETFARSGVKTKEEAIEITKRLRKEKKKEMVRVQKTMVSKPGVKEPVDEEELRKQQEELLKLFNKG